MSRRRALSLAPIGRRRSAMGEFIPEPGQRPLTAHGQPTPSGFDYQPNTALTMPTLPSHSLYSRPRPLTKEATPSPAHYSTSKDAVWRRRSFTVTKKGTTRPYDIREHVHITCSPGAAHYRQVYGDTGSATKRSMSAWHREGVHAGHPNPLVQPVDTLGFNTPGPDLWRESERGTEKTFGKILRPAHRDTERPGPAAYSLPSPAVPVPLCGERLHVDTDLHYPAPNEYSIPETMGTGQVKTFGTKHDLGTDQQFPAPNEYSLRRPGSVSHPFCSPPFPAPVEQRPGPAEYSSTDSNLPMSPDYSCRAMCRPGFPDILLYPEFATLQPPGAGEYEYDREFTDNSSPKHSLGLPLPRKPNMNPGPNHYRVQHESTLPCPPSFTMAHKLPALAGETNWPGPAHYNPRPRPSTTVSITSRRTRDTVLQGPAANCYHVPGTQTRRGNFPGVMASLKGRRSTACYSGFPSSHLSRLASLAM